MFEDTTEKRARGAKGAAWKVIIVGCVLLLALAVLRKRTAPTPEAFAGAVPLQSAVEESAKDGMAIVVLATADWCGPCQAFKRGALADAEVNAWLRSATRRVHLDLSDRENLNPDADRLAISALPTMLVLRGGKEVSRLEGGVDRDELLAWLRMHTGALNDAKARGMQVEGTPMPPPGEPAPNSEPTQHK